MIAGFGVLAGELGNELARSRVWEDLCVIAMSVIMVARVLYNPSFRCALGDMAISLGHHRA